jgi:hypothetical protein
MKITLLSSPGWEKKKTSLRDTRLFSFYFLFLKEDTRLDRESRPVRLAYQPLAISTFLSEQTSHQQSANSTFLLEQISTSHQPNEQASRL